MKTLWIAAGFASLTLGAIGIFLPLLPTVPFLLLTAFCFARASDRLHDWLLSHKTFGPPIIAWRDHGAIGRRAKLLATLSIAAAFLISIALRVPAALLIIQLVALACVLIFIWSRPER